VESPPTEVEPPPPTGAQLLAAQPAEVQQALQQHQAGSPWPTYRTAATVLYPYSAMAEPVVDCAPLRTTDLQLQTDETVTDIAIGDQERWMATPASSGDPRDPIAHIALKPQLAGIATNLTIYTTRHIYHLSLRARGRALEEVAFYYPDELLTAMRAADAAAKTPAADPRDPTSDAMRLAAVDPSRLNFAYEISGANVAWRPVRAFDDGAHVYLEVPTSMQASSAPALMIAAGGGTQMVNYRVRGSYYVVDRLFDQAVLVSGVGREQDRVTITSAAAGR
jgi:type IV secretion system protein VirB9